jgi:hypothetical protein
MAYQVTGESLHELIGIGMTVLVIIHQILNVDDSTFEALVSHYKTLVRYINFDDKGMVLGYGCGSPGMTKRSRYPEEAYRLGRTIF